jgi:S-formylglutathione hydrolase FrmB
MNIRASFDCDSFEAWQWISFLLTELPHTCTGGFTAQFKDSAVGINAE